MNCQPFDLIALGATELKQKKASTIGNYLKRGAEAFTFAVKKKWITENPFPNIAERKQNRIELCPDKKQRQEELLTVEVVERLMACHKSSRSERENCE